jgi:hypothetical protein
LGWWLTLTALAVVWAVFLAMCSAAVVRGEHGAVACGGDGQKACLALTSPLTQLALREAGEVTWCLNTRAANYPGFRAQTVEVMDAFARELGLTHREVAYPAARDASCNVRHDMPDSHACAGCAAWILTQNWPVVVEYKWQLSYVSWRTTIGHELGHGLCLLDEHYDKQGFRSYVLTFGGWIHGLPTVMDVGTHQVQGYMPFGIWFPTPEYDSHRCRETLSPPFVSAWAGRHPDGTPFVWYCNTDRRATRVTFVYWSAERGYEWGGEYHPLAPGAGNCVGRLVPDGLWVSVRQENALWQLAGDTWVLP